MRLFYSLLFLVISSVSYASEAFFVRHEYAQVLRVKPVVEEVVIERQRLVCHAPNDSFGLEPWRLGAQSQLDLSPQLTLPGQPWQQCWLRLEPEIIRVDRGYQVRFIYRGQMYETITSKPPAERLKLQLVLIPEIE